MHTSTELEFAADAREPASVGAPRTKAQLFLWLREIARNDAVYAREASIGEKGDAWARHAHAANGFGAAATIDTMDAGTIDTISAPAIAATRIATIAATPFAPPDSHDLYHAARRDRSIIISEAIAGAIVAVGATVREASARYRKHRQAAATCATLRGLDDHMLHDLGFDRSELASVAAESAGEIERTRLRALPQASGRSAGDPTQQSAI